MLNRRYEEWATMPSRLFSDDYWFPLLVIERLLWYALTQSEPISMPRAPAPYRAIGSPFWCRRAMSIESLPHAAHYAMTRYELLFRRHDLLHLLPSSVSLSILTRFRILFFPQHLYTGDTQSQCRYTHGMIFIKILCYEHTYDDARCGPYYSVKFCRHARLCALPAYLKKEDVRASRRWLMPLSANADIHHARFLRHGAFTPLIEILLTLMTAAATKATRLAAPQYFQYGWLIYSQCTSRARARVRSGTNYGLPHFRYDFIIFHISAAVCQLAREDYRFWYSQRAYIMPDENAHYWFCFSDSHFLL